MSYSPQSHECNFQIPFSGCIASVRSLHEPAITNFVRLKLQCETQLEDVEDLLRFVKQQERIKHHANATLAALPEESSLIAVAHATQRRPGRPANASTSGTSTLMSTSIGILNWTQMVHELWPASGILQVYFRHA